jgi:hypothetical protein
MAETNPSQAITLTDRPDAALQRFDVLIGTWDMIGHTLDAEEDNITGQNTFEWLPGGFFLKSSGNIDFMGTKLWSMEIIGYNAVTQTFPSKVYSSMTGEMLDYGWNIQGNIVTHWDSTSKFTGTLSDDGNTLIGGWRPNEGEENSPGSTYDVVMTRIK